MCLINSLSHGNSTHPFVNGGDFVFYPHGPSGEKYTFPAEYNQAIVLDGTMTPHGVEPYRKDVKPVAGHMVHIFH